MSSKLARQKIRRSYTLNHLEGKYVIFTSGKWVNNKISLDKRSNKGIWDISWYERFEGWKYDRISEQELFNCCDEIKAIVRDYRLDVIL